MVSSESNRREDDRDYYYCEGLVGSHLNPALSTMTIDSFFFFFFFFISLVLVLVYLDPPGLVDIIYFLL